MDAIEHTLKITVLESQEEYPSYLSKIKDEAIAQMDRSYAPYSQFNVGAAALLDNGKIYGGCNQENASYPLCMCAERVALYNVGASADAKIKAIAVVARNSKHVITEPVAPCGACRQVMLEFEEKQNQDIIIFMIGPGDLVYKIENAKSLLPINFGKEHLLK